ncbi:hypothetical protein [Streptomyces noursei]
MSTRSFTPYLAPIGGIKRAHPELTDHCRPPRGRTYPEHHYGAPDQEECQRCGARELRPANA